MCSVGCNGQSTVHEKAPAGAEPLSRDGARRKYFSAGFDASLKDFLRSQPGQAGRRPRSGRRSTRDPLNPMESISRGSHDKK